MSDLQAIWKLSLAVGCAAGAAWFKWCGVMHDGLRESDRGSDALDRSLVSGRDAGRGSDRTMKGCNGNGQVIDFEDHRNRRALRKWAADNGFGPRAGEVK